MGAFYGSIHVRTEDRAAILDAVEKFTRRRKIALLVGPILRGWVEIYPSGHGQEERTSSLLSKMIPGEIIHLIVHDDDIFSYCYYRDGKVVDRFRSRPDYFAPVSTRTRTQLRGRPERLAHLLPDASRLTDLKELLSSQGTDVALASRLLERFAELLDIPNAAEAYEYLQESDGEGVEGWDKFIHVPDLSEERGRQLAAATEQSRRKQQFLNTGVLRHIESRPAVHKEFRGSVLFCPDDLNGFLVYWSDAPTVDARPIEQYVPGRTPIAKPIAVHLKPAVHFLTRSPSGRFLAVGHGYPSFKTAVWDLAAGTLVQELHPANGACFSQDESKLITIGQSGCLISRIDTGEQVAAVPLTRAQIAAIHPDGTLIVGSQSGHLHLIDVSSGKLRTTLLVGDRKRLEELRGRARSVFEQMLQSWDTPEAKQRLEAYVKELESQSQPQFGSGSRPETVIDPSRFRQQVEALRESTMRQLDALGTVQLPQNGSEIPVSMAVSDDGRWLALGTSRGLRVFDWQDLLRARDYLPTPVAKYDSIPGPLGGETKNVNGVAWNMSGPGVFFGGLDARIEYLDLSTGTHRVLCELPGRVDFLAVLGRGDPLPFGGPAIMSLCRTTDGSSLACWVIPDACARQNACKPPELMIWDCAALLRQ